MYKKRSQSSLRSKTLQSEDDSADQNFWIGNAQAKKVLSRVSQKFTTSMIEQNKENSSLNLPAYQSVSDVPFDEKHEGSLI